MYQSNQNHTIVDKTKNVFSNIMPSSSFNQPLGNVSMIPPYSQILTQGSPQPFIFPQQYPFNSVLLLPNLNLIQPNFPLKMDNYQKPHYIRNRKMWPKKLPSDFKTQRNANENPEYKISTPATVSKKPTKDLNLSNNQKSNNVEHKSWNSKIKDTSIHFDLAKILANSQNTRKKNKKWTVVDSRIILAEPKKETVNDSFQLKIRGKEREKSKKKPSTLKRIIMKERNEQQSKRDVMDWKLDIGCAEDNKGPGEIDLAKQAKAKLHNRKFRDYCSNCLRPEIDRECGLLLKLIYDFQHRAYLKNQRKTQSKRRYIAGMRQVLKYTSAKMLKCVVIAPNCEPVQSAGGLDDLIMKIINACKEQDVLCVFALNRRALGRCLNLAVPVSAVGIIDYSGADVVYKRLKSIANEAQNDYATLLQNTVDMIKSGKMVVDKNQTDEDNDDLPTASSRFVDPLNQQKSHTRNFSGTLKPQTNRLIVHGRNPSDISSYTGVQNTLKDSQIRRECHHSRNGSLVSNISGSQADEQIDAYEERIRNEFIGEQTGNTSIKEFIDVQSDMDGDISSEDDYEQNSSDDDIIQYSDFNKEDFIINKCNSNNGAIFPYNNKEICAVNVSSPKDSDMESNVEDITAVTTGIDSLQIPDTA